MKSYKKNLALLTALLMLGSLCACGGESALTTGETTGESSQGTTVPTDPGAVFEDYSYQYQPGRHRDWEMDVVVLAKTFLTKHPKLADTYYFESHCFDTDPAQYLVEDNGFYDEALRETFAGEITSLIERIPELTDVEIQYELQRIVALIGDAHSGVSFERDRFFPIMITELEHEDVLGYYVVRIPSEYEECIYSQLVSINGIPLADVIDLLRPYISSENGGWEEFNIFDNFWSSRLFWLDALRIIGVVPWEEERAEFELLKEDGTTEMVTLDAITYEQYDVFGMTRVDFYARGIGNLKYSGEKNYWYELLEDGTLYACVTACTESSDDPFSTFCNEILEMLTSADMPRKLVIDLRHNTGGSYPMSGFEDFAARLGSVETDGIYILIDHGVFSSGNGMAGKLACTVPSAVFVGSPTGQPACVWGNSRYYTLPCSLIQFRLSTSYWMFAQTLEGDALMPDLTVYQTLEDHKQGIDTVLEAVLHTD